MEDYSVRISQASPTKYKSKNAERHLHVDDCTLRVTQGWQMRACVSQLLHLGF
jgi:hypothetical protein